MTGTLKTYTFEPLNNKVDFSGYSGFDIHNLLYIYNLTRDIRLYSVDAGPRLAVPAAKTDTHVIVSVECGDYDADDVLIIRYDFEAGTGGSGNSSAPVIVDFQLEPYKP